MPCGCGKKSVPPEEATMENPVLIGPANGRPAVYARTLTSINALRKGTETWIAGAHVQPLISRGYLELVEAPVSV